MEKNYIFANRDIFYNYPYFILKFNYGKERINERIATVKNSYDTIFDTWQPPLIYL